MKCILFVFLFFLVEPFCWAQDTNFTFKGRLNQNSEVKKVFLHSDKLSLEIPVSANKEFSYSGYISDAELGRIITDKTKGAIPIWITTGEVIISLEEYSEVQRDSTAFMHLKVNSLTGPAETEKYQWFLNETRRISKLFPGLSSYAQFRDSMAKYYDPILEEYILLYPGSKFSYYVSKLAFGRENTNKFLSLIDTEIGGEEGMRLVSRLKQDSVTKTGILVQDFKMKTVNGKLFSLQNNSSTYLLLDFWSHDCYPCRAQHPELIRIYNQFQSKGFEIVGIALDDSKRKWREAIEKDKISWIHVSDLKGWNNFLAKRYFVESIPFNILIDQNRKIIATGLSPKALQQKLKELFSN